jgi:copper chaperone CopZ
VPIKQGFLMKSSPKLNVKESWHEWPSPALGQELYKGVPMAQEMTAEEWVVIPIGGMHCHRCEASIQKQLSQIPGVHEAEVDFNSGQASVLFDRAKVTQAQLLEAIREAGYQVKEANL